MPQPDYRQAGDYLDMYTLDYDKLYREPTDGYVGMRLNRENVGEFYHGCPEQGVSFQEPNKNIALPQIELVTIIDLSTLWEDKQ